MILPDFAQAGTKAKVALMFGTCLLINQKKHKNPMLFVF